MLLYNTIKKGKGLITNDTLNHKSEEYLHNLHDFLYSKKGAGFINTALRKLPLPEMHLKLPSDVQSETVENGSFSNTGKYSFCGPGTKVRKRLEEGYKGVNSLDRVCKQHDIAYSKHKDTKDRNVADDILAKQASEIALDTNEPDYVRHDAKLVTGIMGLKSRFGMGMNSKNLEASPCTRAR